MKFRQAWTRITYAIAGNPEDLSTENRFFNTILFGTVIIGIYGTVFNILVGLNLVLVISTIVANSIALAVYIMSRFYRLYSITRVFFSFLVPVLLSLVWFQNGGTKGPVIFMYFVYFSFILLDWEGRTRNWLLIILGLNLTLLYLLEYTHPELVTAYKTESNRLVDVYSGMILFFGLAGVLILYAKRNYIRERKKAEQSDRLKSSFLANMSHEIRTPMNSIIGFSRLLERDLTSDKRNYYIRIIDENGKYLLKLINDIIDISRIEADNLAIKKQSCNLHNLFVRLQTIFSQVIRNNEKTAVTLSFDYLPAEFSIETDSFRLEQILTNLLMNAIKFTLKGEIRVGAEPQGDYLRFYVNDTGIGIREENLEEVFDRFFKVEDEGMQYIQRGTGIGLSISKKLTELMGGKMWVESTYGKGSTFYFTLPRKEVPLRSMPEYKTIAGPGLIDWSGKKLLIAEDEETNYYLLKELFTPSQIQVYRARNGKEAITRCSETEFDLILMDIKMPGMDGYATTRQIRKQLPAIPVLAITALSMEGDKEKCLAAGCDDYISKPLDQELLLMKVKLLLDHNVKP